VSHIGNVATFAIIQLLFLHFADKSNKTLTTSDWFLQKVEIKVSAMLSGLTKKKLMLTFNPYFCDIRCGEKFKLNCFN